jgi:hypothetical protein
MMCLALASGPARQLCEALHLFSPLAKRACIQLLIPRRSELAA